MPVMPILLMIWRKFILLRLSGEIYIPEPLWHCKYATILRKSGKYYRKSMAQRESGSHLSCCSFKQRGNGKEKIIPIKRISL